MMDYDQVYRREPSYFGTEPVGIVRDYWHLLHAERPVLDVGVGQGRNALFLARKGLTVDGMDPSHVALQTVMRIAKRERLRVRLFQCGFEVFQPDVDWYCGVLALGLIQTLSRPMISLLAGRLKDWTSCGSLLFLTAFTTRDPWVRHPPSRWRRVDRNCYSDGADGFRTYLEAGELLDLFPDWEVVYHWEGLGPMHRHGDGSPHSHGSARAVLRCPGSPAASTVRGDLGSVTTAKGV